MSKAEKFIQDYTRNCSNEILSPYPQINNDIRRIDGEPAKEFSPWLTPDQARRAVEIAIEETIEKACDIIRHKYGHYHYLRGNITEELINEFVKAMKDE